MYSVLRVVLHDTFDYSTAPFSRDAGQLDHLSSITRFNLRLLPTSRGRKNRFFFYFEKHKEAVTISDLRESSGGRFAATAHVEARFSCYFHILFTSRTLQNSHVKAFCFRKIFAHGKIKSGRKSLVKKKRKGTNLSRKEKNFLCESDWYWRSSKLAFRFQTKKSLSNQNLPYIMLKTSFHFLYASTSLDTKTFVY